MKKKILALFMLCLMFYSVCFAYTNAKNYAPTYGTLTSNSNLRTGPSTSYKSLKVLPAGSNVKIVGEIDNFYIVQTASNQVGMISKDLVKSSSTAPEGAATYTNLEAKIGTIKDSVVNIRSGPATSFSIVTKLYKSNKVKVIGEINDFYMIITENNNIRYD